MRILKTLTSALFLLLFPCLINAQYLIQYPDQVSTNVMEITCVDTDMTCENGYISWDDGRTFEGAILNGQPHGEGKMTWATDIYYQGSFKNGNRHGYGKMVNQQTTYDGEWRDDLIGDQGAAIFGNGDEYLGAFMDGTIHGKGTMRYNNGALYSGDWKDGNPHGMGSMIRADKSTFTGMNENGMRMGQGIVTWTTGDTLRGSWQNNRLTGKATYFFRNGDRLVSNWRNGKLSNRATYRFKSGEELTGNLQQLKEEANLQMKTILETEANFQLAWMGIAMEFKTNGEYELATDFLGSARQYATTVDIRYDLIDKVMLEVKALQKEKGMANLPKVKGQ